MSCSAVSEVKGDKGKKQNKGGSTPANLGSTTTLQDVRQVRIDKVSDVDFNRGDQVLLEKKIKRQLVSVASANPVHTP